MIGVWGVIAHPAPFLHEMDCYSCHEQHGAVDTTFVQFYPTLINLAQQKGTLSDAYKKDEEKVNGLDSMLGASQEAETSNVSHPLVTALPTLTGGSTLTS